MNVFEEWRFMFLACAAGTLALILLQSWFWALAGWLIDAGIGYFAVDVDSSSRLEV